MSHTIRCPKCRKTKTGSTQHGFKAWALLHAVKCGAERLTITTQKTIEDFYPDEESET